MLVHQFVRTHPQDFVRAGFEAGPAAAEELFQKIISEPGGVKVGVLDAENNLAHLETPDRN